MVRERVKHVWRDKSESFKEILTEKVTGQFPLLIINLIKLENVFKPEK